MYVSNSSSPKGVEHVSLLIVGGTSSSLHWTLSCLCAHAQWSSVVSFRFPFQAADLWVGQLDSPELLLTRSRGIGPVPMSESSRTGEGSERVTFYAWPISRTSQLYINWTRFSTTDMQGLKGGASYIWVLAASTVRDINTEIPNQPVDLAIFLLPVVQWEVSLPISHATPRTTQGCHKERMRTHENAGRLGRILHLSCGKVTG